MADNNNNINVDEVVENIKNLNNTADTTGAYDTQDINDNKLMAILAYIGILVLIPLFAAKKSKFARFHTNQGLVFFLANLALGLVYNIVVQILGGIPVISILVVALGYLVSLVLFVVMIIGIVNAVQGRAKELPVIGKIRILK